jgi:hypothetical protein
MLVGMGVSSVFVCCDFIYGFVGEVGAIVLSVTYTPLYIG